LQRARAELFEQEEGGEVAQVALVRKREDSAQMLRIDVCRRTS
jgi:hypothetical protein